MITIDKNVPLSENRSGRPAIYPWADMAFGDSFAVEAADKESVELLRRSLYAAAGQFRSKCHEVGDWRITTRVTENPDGTGTLRVWKVKP